MAENLQSVINSFSYSSTFKQGVIKEDRLLPAPHERVQTTYLNSWRRVNVTDLDWNNTNYKVITFPESCRVVSSVFLEIDLPELTGDTYVPNVGIYILRELDVHSKNESAYKITKYKEHLRDFLESLSDEACKACSDAYFGGTEASSDARKIYIPLLTPNSHFRDRDHRNSRGMGSLPCNFNSTPLEFWVKLNASENITTGGAAADSIKDHIQLSIREVKMSESDLRLYEGARGSYSVVTRTLKPLTKFNGFEKAASGSTTKVEFAGLDGCITEFDIVAVTDADPSAASEVKDLRNLVSPSAYRLICDGEIVRQATSKAEIRLEAYKQGFVPNKYFQQPCRVCFGSHVASKVYTGSFMMDNVSNTRLEIDWDENVQYCVLYSQMQNVTMDATGRIESSLK